MTLGKFHLEAFEFAMWRFQSQFFYCKKTEAHYDKVLDHFHRFIFENENTIRYECKDNVNMESYFHRLALFNFKSMNQRLKAFSFFNPIEDLIMGAAKIVTELTKLIAESISKLF